MTRVYTLRQPRRTAPEKAEERMASKLMCDALGFTRWNLQQSRATKQTPGWPDVLYTHQQRGLAVFYEAKAPKGKQSPAQREFQSHVTAAGMAYVVGTHEAMTVWAVARGLVKVTTFGTIEVLR